MSLTLQIYLLSILLSIKFAFVILLLVSLAIFIATLLICVSMSDEEDNESKEKKEKFDFGMSVLVKSFICILVFGVINIVIPSKNMCYTMFAAYSLEQGNLEKVIDHLEGPTKQIMDIISGAEEKEDK